MIDQESVLSRWSRRKRQSEQESIEEDLLLEQPQSPALMDTGVADDQPPDQPESLKQAVLSDKDMPDLDTLDEESDFSAFMSPGVSEELRNLALRKLFRSQLFNVCDGLDEYDEDYTSFEKLGDIVTCDMKHQLEMEARKKLEQEPEQVAGESTPVETLSETADQSPPAQSASDTTRPNPGSDESNANTEAQHQKNLSTAESDHDHEKSST